MPDPTPTPAPAPAPAPAAPQSPGLFDKAQLETVKNGESLATNAKDAAYNPTLLAEGMKPGTPDALLAAAGQWRDFSQKAVDADTEGKKATGLGTDSEVALRREVEYFRSKAQLAIAQHPQWTKAEVDAFKERYFINHKIFENEGTAEQSAAAVFDHGEADGLPAITPARLVKARGILDQFSGKDTSQSGPQSKATQFRDQREAAFALLMQLRHEIQHCVDGGYPWWNDANIATRRLFKLPIGRPFTS